MIQSLYLSSVFQWRYLTRHMSRQTFRWHTTHDLLPFNRCGFISLVFLVMFLPSGPFPCCILSLSSTLSVTQQMAQTNFRALHFPPYAAFHRSEKKFWLIQMLRFVYKCQETLLCNICSFINVFKGFVPHSLYSLKYPVYSFRVSHGRRFVMNMLQLNL